MLITAALAVLITMKTRRSLLCFLTSIDHSAFRVPVGTEGRVVLLQRNFGRKML